MAVEHQTAETSQIRQTKTSARLLPGSLILGGLSALGVLISIWMIFFYAPMDISQGDAQRIFYFHVPAAWVGMLSFVILAVSGIIYLFKPRESLDLLARAAAEIGCVFLGLALVLGSIWGKWSWGTWWVWDPKLTATLILWFMFVGYLMLRNYMGVSHDSARAGAVWGIVGVFDVPIIYLSVQWWRGQHPGPEVSASGGLPPEAWITLAVATVTFTLFYAFLMGQVYRLHRLQTTVQRLRAIVE